MQRLQVIGILLLVVYSFSSALPAQAAPDAGVDHIVISEVQVGSDSAREEFIELYNPTDAPIDLTKAGWLLEYRPVKSDGTDSECAKWSKKLEFTDPDEVIRSVIEPRGFLLLVTSQYLEAAELADPGFSYDATFSSGLKDDEGHIRIGYQDPDAEETVEVDKVGWGEEAECAEGPGGGRPVLLDESEDLELLSMQRMFMEAGQIQDTDVNQEDFKVDEPNPQSTPPPSDGAPDGPEEDPEEEPPPDEPEDPAYLKLDITEVLPDPDKPQTDADDEFVELFNPNAGAVNLKGYALKTGSSLQTSHTFGPATIQPKSYKAFYSRSIKMGLANAGGRVQLLDPTGKIVSELVSYPKAETGKSWAKVSGKWQWTDRLTPGGLNKPHTTVPPDDTGTSRATGSTSTRLGPFAKINITELLPDPAAPQTDAEDEYVELYNPNDYPVDLTDYVIQTGSNFRSKHTIDGIKIEAKQYIAVFNSAANLSLTNKGGAARLLDPAGKAISTTDTYPKAETGAAWAFAAGKWQWTAAPTPAAKNILSALEDNSNITTAATSSSASQDRARAVLAAPATVQTTATTNAIVAGAAGSALLYGLYEWRGDFRNIIERLRRYRQAWRRRRG